MIDWFVPSHRSLEQLLPYAVHAGTVCVCLGVSIIFLRYPQIVIHINHAVASNGGTVLLKLISMPVTLILGKEDDLTSARRFLEGSGKPKNLTALSHTIHSCRITATRSGFVEVLIGALHSKAPHLTPSKVQALILNILADICKEESCRSQVIHQNNKLIPLILRHLEGGESHDPELQAATCRALRYVSWDSLQHLSILQDSDIRKLVGLLDSTSLEVRIQASQTLHHVLDYRDDFDDRKFAPNVRAADGIKLIIPHLESSRSAEEREWGAELLAALLPGAEALDLGVTNPILVLSHLIAKPDNEKMQTACIRALANATLILGADQVPPKTVSCLKDLERSSPPGSDIGPVIQAALRNIYAGTSPPPYQP